MSLGDSGFLAVFNEIRCLTQGPRPTKLEVSEQAAAQPGRGRPHPMLSAPATLDKLCLTSSQIAQTCKPLAFPEPLGHMTHPETLSKPQETWPLRGGSLQYEFSPTSLPSPLQVSHFLTFSCTLRAWGTFQSSSCLTTNLTLRGYVSQDVCAGTVHTSTTHTGSCS